MPKTQDIIERELDHRDSHPSSMQPFLDLLESEEGECAFRAHPPGDSDLIRPPVPI